MMIFRKLIGPIIGIILPLYTSHDLGETSSERTFSFKCRVLVKVSAQGTPH